MTERGQGLPSVTEPLLNSGWADKHCWCWELALPSKEAGMTLVPQGFRPLVAARGTGLCALRVPSQSTCWPWKSSFGNSGLASQVAMASARICLQCAQASCSKHKRMAVVLLGSNCFCAVEMRCLEVNKLAVNSAFYLVLMACTN